MNNIFQTVNSFIEQHRKHCHTICRAELVLGNNEHSHIVVAVVQGTLPEPEVSAATQTACFNIVLFDRIKCTRLNTKELRSCLGSISSNE